MAGFSAIVTLIVSIIGVALFFFAVSAIKHGSVNNCGFLMLIEKPAAVFEYALFALVIENVLSEVFSLFVVSNHTVMSLDIIYLFTILILVMFQIIKEPANLLNKTV